MEKELKLPLWLRLMLEERCCVDGCERRPKLGYIACRRHVRERQRLIRRVGYGAAASV